VLVGADGNSQGNRVIVLRRDWEKDPWSELDERDHPQNWDNRIPLIVLPSPNANDADMGRWLKNFVPRHRNTVRFLLPKKGTESLFYDKALIILARAVFLADQWKKSDGTYSVLHIKYQKELRDQLKNRFDRFAILETWNFGQPEQCKFLVSSHGSEGSNILRAIQEHIRRELLIPEELADVVTEASKNNRSVAELLEQLQEPMTNGQPCIPWLGETEAKERITRICAQGQVAINLMGRDMLERRAGETEDDAWNRMKGRLGSGRQLEETSLHEPGSMVSSGGAAPTPSTGQAGVSEPAPGSGAVPAPGAGAGAGLFGGSTGARQRLQAPPTSALSLLGKLETWGVNAGTPLHNMNLNVGQLTGSQLEKLLKQLPDGITYALDLEKEDLTSKPQGGQ